MKVCLFFLVSPLLLLFSARVPLLFFLHSPCFISFRACSVPGRKQWWLDDERRYTAAAAVLGHMHGTRVRTGYAIIRGKHIVLRLAAGAPCLSVLVKLEDRSSLRLNYTYVIHPHLLRREARIRMSFRGAVISGDRTVSQHLGLYGYHHPPQVVVQPCRSVAVAAMAAAAMV